MSKVTTPISITDLIKHSEKLADYSNQKVSALLTQLLKEGKVVRTEEKGRSKYSLSAENADEGE
jgi:DNA-binding transcriptional regulator PaaX